jgi:predicted O-methyltransferase YrrM
VRTLPGRAEPRSCTDEEGLALYDLIAAGGLQSGFELGTGFGYSTAYIGMALARNGGGLLSMDSAVDGLEFAAERLSPFGLDDVVTLSHGVSPGSLREALFGRLLDFAFLDGGPDRLGDLEALLPYLEPRCAVVLRGAARDEAVAAMETALGSAARVLPSRGGLTLVARGLDPGVVDGLARHFVRARG